VSRCSGERGKVFVNQGAAFYDRATIINGEAGSYKVRPPWSKLEEHTSIEFQGDG